MNMKAHSLLLMALSFYLLVGSVRAQGKWTDGRYSWSAGVQSSVLTGALDNLAGIGFGLFGNFQYALNRQWAATGSLGYTFWTQKSQTLFGGYQSATGAGAVPFLVGAKYYLSDEFAPGFYATGQVGIYFTNHWYKLNYTDPTTNQSVSITNTDTHDEIVLCPGIGYQFKDVDITAKYVIDGDWGNFAVGVAYVLPFH